MDLTVVYFRASAQISKVELFICLTWVPVGMVCMYWWTQLSFYSTQQTNLCNSANTVFVSLICSPKINECTWITFIQGLLWPHKWSISNKEHYELKKLIGVKIKIERKAWITKHCDRHARSQKVDGSITDCSFPAHICRQSYAQCTSEGK